MVVIPEFSLNVKSLLNPGPCRISLIRTTALPVEIPVISFDPTLVKVYAEVLPSNLLERLSKI